MMENSPPSKLLETLGSWIQESSSLRMPHNNISTIYVTCLGFFFCFLEIILSTDIHGAKRALRNIFKHH